MPRAAARAADALWGASRWAARLARGEFVKRAGGPARARVIAVFGAVLALSAADTSTVGAIAPQLESALDIGATQIGLLISVGLLVGAVLTIPAGMLVDRSKRVPLLSLSIFLWSLASLLSAFAGSYSTLLLTRAALGGVAATAGPAIASLTGDYFAPDERGRIYAYILGGEVAGSAIGYIVSGSVASLIDWRAAFVVLAVPGFVLARTLWRTVPEPLRGGQCRLGPGVADLDAAVASAKARASHAHVAPEHEHQTSLFRALIYSLSVRSNAMLIAGTSLGYFYYQGVAAFAVLFVAGHYHASQAGAELVLGLLVVGALIGTLVSGRLTDLMVARGMLIARVIVPAACYVLAAILLVPGFVGTSLMPALWFDVAGIALIAAANPPLQAARLDIMPAALWGRAGGAQTALRSLAQGIAPTVFGAVTSLVAGIVPSEAPIGTHPRTPSPETATGLEVTFLLMLATLVAGGIFLARARSTYVNDVATAAAFDQRAS